MKISFGLLVGAATIAVIAHYAGTPEGKALIKKVCKDAEELGDNLSAVAEGLVGKGKEFFEKATDPAGSSTSV